MGKHESLAKPKEKCLEKMHAHICFSLADSGWLVTREGEVLMFATLINHQIYLWD